MDHLLCLRDRLALPNQIGFIARHELILLLKQHRIRVKQHPPHHLRAGERHRVPCLILVAS